MKKNIFLRKLSEFVNPIEYENGNITIKKNKKKIWMKNLFKLSLVVFLSSMLGVFISIYIITYRYIDIINDQINSSIQLSTNENNNSNKISSIVKVVAPSIVTVGSDTNKLDIDGSNCNNVSGVIIRSDGYILTSSSCIKDFDNIYVKLPSEGVKPFTAEIIGKDETSDLAIIKIDANNLPKIKFSDGKCIEVGEQVIAIGNSIGSDYVGIVTTGIITSLNKRIRLNVDKQIDGFIYDIIETDTIINSENNSGILCNLQGEVVGINSLMLTKNYSKNTLNYVLSSSDTKRIIDSIFSYKDLTKVSLGVDGVALIFDDSSNMEGVFIKVVDENGSAYNAGLRPKDIIVELEGTKIKKVEDIIDILKKHESGDIINCKVIRDDIIKEYAITLQNKKI